MTQHWRCQHCKARGAVRIPRHADVLTGARIVMADHERERGFVRGAICEASVYGLRAVGDVRIR